MASLIPNIAKGKWVRYAMLPEASDGLVAIILQKPGLVTDAALRDIDTIADLLAGASDEATFTNYTRQPLTGVVITVDDVNDWTTVDCNDPSWTPGSQQAIGKIVFAYDPDTTGGSDADLLPLYYDDFDFTTPASGVISFAVAAAGWGKAS